LELPAPFADEASTRGYYGTMSHNVKAVYQRYLGYFDGNPAHLHPLPPEQAGAKYVELMGGRDAVLASARAMFARGEYRFTAEVLNHLVFSAPEDAEARQLQADTFEQMGYQAESAVWRNFYLQGARELRNGVLALGGVRLSNPDIAKAMTSSMLLDVVGIRLNADRLGSGSGIVGLELLDRDERRTVWFENRTIHHRPGLAKAAQVSVKGPHAAVAALCTGEESVEALTDRGDLTVEGDRALLDSLWACLETFDLGWGVATP
jgi:alkyl sulfatase BDS1-like metallo-beta-lactamase superfamily hydrolase